MKSLLYVINFFFLELVSLSFRTHSVLMQKLVCWSVLQFVCIFLKFLNFNILSICSLSLDLKQFYLSFDGKIIPYPMVDGTVDSLSATPTGPRGEKQTRFFLVSATGNWK